MAHETSISPDMIPGEPQRGPSEEQMQWQGRPALRAEIWVWLMLIAGCQLAGYLIERIDAQLIEMGIRVIPTGGLGLPQFPITGAAALTWLAIGVAGWRVLSILMMRFELTDQYLYVHRGVLNRLHDQLELHRVRDVEVKEPIHVRVLGLGRIIVHSVDRTTPMLKIPAQRNAVTLGRGIYQAAKAEQQRLGYREFEGTASL